MEMVIDEIREKQDMGGWMDGWMDRWMDGWITQFNITFCTFVIYERSTQL